MPKTASDANYLFSEKQVVYSHAYERYIDFFKDLAFATRQLDVHCAPSCWWPFIRYLGHKPRTFTEQFDEDSLCDWNACYDHAEDKRRAVEIASVCRPELAHALYLADTEWPCPLRQHEMQKEFVVTCNGSLHRPEIFEYTDRLQQYDPCAPRVVEPESFSKRRCPPLRCVIVPCAADKPYPALLHRTVRERIPSAWQIIIASGVLGLIPDDLWDQIPHYDSGIPYQHRVTKTVAWYFSKHFYKHVVVYSDFYARAIRIGLASTEGPSPTSTFIFGHYYRNQYANLLLEEHLQSLEATTYAIERSIKQ